MENYGLVIMIAGFAGLIIVLCCIIMSKDKKLNIAEKKFQDLYSETEIKCKRYELVISNYMQSLSDCKAELKQERSK